MLRLQRPAPAGRPEGKPALNGTMRALLKLSRGIDAVNFRFGIMANYFVLFSALLSAGNAMFRYGINGFIELSRDFHFLAGIQDLVKWYGNSSNSFLEGVGAVAVPFDQVLDAGEEMEIAAELDKPVDAVAEHGVAGAEQRREQHEIVCHDAEAKIHGVDAAAELQQRSHGPVQGRFPLRAASRGRPL